MKSKRPMNKKQRGSYSTPWRKGTQQHQKFRKRNRAINLKNSFYTMSPSNDSIFFSAIDRKFNGTQIQRTQNLAVERRLQKLDLEINISSDEVMFESSRIIARERERERERPQRFSDSLITLTQQFEQWIERLQSPRSYLIYLRDGGFQRSPKQVPKQDDNFQCPIVTKLKTIKAWFFKRNRHLKIDKNLLNLYQECPICCMEYDGSDSGESYVTELYCGHNFHTECIEGWLDLKNTCPCCRRDFRMHESYAQWDQNYKDFIAPQQQQSSLWLGYEPFGEDEWQGMYPFPF